MESPACWSRLAASLAVAPLDDTAEVGRFLRFSGLLGHLPDSFPALLQAEHAREITGPSAALRIAGRLEELGAVLPEALRPDPYGHRARRARAAFVAMGGASWPRFDATALDEVEGAVWRPLEPDPMGAAVRDFVDEFLPPAAASSNDLYFGLGPTIPWAPRASALVWCLRACQGLVALASAAPVRALDLREAAEVAAAYVGRAEAETLDAHAIRLAAATLAHDLDRLLAHPWVARFSSYDAVKRLDALRAALRG